MDASIPIVKRIISLVSKKHGGFALLREDSYFC